VLPLSDWIQAALQSAAPDVLPAHIATGVVGRIGRLSPYDGLCHCDIHPGNVMMTAQGPKLIDWTGAIGAAPALDLAVSHVLHLELIPDNHDDPERPRRINSALQSGYAGLAGLSPGALAAEVEVFLPIARAFALLGLGAGPAQRARLIGRIEASLGLAH
jgi:Ser/Thr protein kinase RdoA (MazF antagonist)